MEPYNETHVLISKKTLLVIGRTMQLMSHVISQKEGGQNKPESYRDAFQDAATREVDKFSQEQIDKEINQITA